MIMLASISKISMEQALGLMCLRVHGVDPNETSDHLHMFSIQ